MLCYACLCFTCFLCLEFLFFNSYCKFKTGKPYKIQFSANVFVKLSQISIAGNGLSLLPKLSPQSSCMAYNSELCHMCDIFASKNTCSIQGKSVSCPGTYLLYDFFLTTPYSFDSLLSPYLLI